MNDKLVFIIPIYFQSKENNANRMEKKRKKYLKENMDHSQRIFRSVSKEDVKMFEELFNKYYYIPWQYTQIVGYIEIRLIDNNLKSYIWYVDAKRLLPNLSSKQFRYKGKICDVSMYLDTEYNNNAKICKDILNFLEFIKKSKGLFKNRYIDTELIENLLSVIDFKKMVQK